MLLFRVEFNQKDDMPEQCTLFLEDGDTEISEKDAAYIRSKYEKIAEKGNGTFSLPDGNFVVCDYEHFRLTKNKQKKQENVCVECDMASGNIVEMDGVYYRFRFEVVAREKLDSEIPQKDYTKWFDYDKIKDSLAIRNRRKGDYFVLDAAGHHKKLEDYFVNEKIPASHRDEQLLLAGEDEIFWIVGGRMAYGTGISDATRWVLEITASNSSH